VTNTLSQSDALSKTNEGFEKVEELWTMANNANVIHGLDPKQVTSYQSEVETAFNALRRAKEIVGSGK
jgi:hypothetical protein